MIILDIYRVGVKKLCRIVLYTILLLTVSVNLFAQRDYDNDFSMGYGLITSQQIFDAATNVLTSAVLPGLYTTSNSQFSGGFFINYKRSISNNWNAGVNLSLDFVTKDVLLQRQKSGDLNRFYYTIAGEFDYRYFKRELFQMYSLVGVAYTIIRDRYMPFSPDQVLKDTSGYVNFQVSLLGIRIGKDLAFFSEIGFGYKGLMNVGFSYQF